MNNEYTKGMSSLTMDNICTRNREFRWDVNHSEKGIPYYRAVIMKAAITNALRYHPWNRRDPHWQLNMKRDVMEYMRTRYSECGFMNFQQQQAQLIFDHRLVCRYLKDETRSITFKKGDIVHVGDQEILVKPDAVVEFGNQIELIWYKIGKPIITQTGKKNAFQRDLQLYAGILYGRKLGFTNITAAYYHLQMRGDTEEWGKNRQTFFGDGGNIINMTDIYLGQENDLDAQMRGHLDILASGVDPEHMLEEDCERCRLKEICKYTLPPTKI